MFQVYFRHLEKPTLEEYDYTTILGNSTNGTEPEYVLVVPPEYVPYESMYYIGLRPHGYGK